MRSDTIKKGFQRAPHRSLLRATGLKDEDFDKPFIGVANSYIDIIPGHFFLNKYAAIVKEEIRKAGGVPFEFNTIGVDDIRTQVNNDIVIKPYSSRYKVYIVDEAEKMNQQAQNALLKTIEEPPAYAIILLLTTNADSFLQTILSRCITLNLKAVKEDKIKEYLMKHYQIPDYQADICAAFSQGNVGKAIQLASSEEFGELKASVLQLMKRLEDIDLYEMTGAVKQIAEYKLSVNDYFDLMMIWFRDVLYLKATNDVDGLIFKDEVYDIKKQAAKRSYQGIETILEALEKAKIRLNANVNFDLVIELLLLTIKEN